MTRIRWTRPLHGELCYHVLAHLDLGRDAASLYNPGLPRQPWAAALLEAYQRASAPGRLVVQVLPLITRNVASLSVRLRAGAVRELNYLEGRALCRQLADALDRELPSVRARWHREMAAARARVEERMTWIAPQLQRLRGAIHEGGEPPPLSLLDCDALACAGGTHGRAAATAEGRVVAVALAAAPREQALIQLMHEELHHVTDAAVRPPRGAQQEQETRRDSDGHQLHRELEQAAVEAGQRLLEREAPELLPAYAAWRRRHGV
jgi:hypothetical protein